MTMTTSYDLLNQVASVLISSLTELKACDVHPGRFTVQEIKRLTTKTPAIYVASLGIAKTEHTGTEQIQAEHRLAAYVITKDAPRLPRHQSAIAIVDTLVAQVPHERWGRRCGPAQNVRAENLYSGQADRAGIAVWAVTWNQSVSLGESVADEFGIVPAQLYIGLEPETGPENADKYQAGDV